MPALNAPDWGGAVMRATTWSPFLANLLNRNSEQAQALASGDVSERMTTDADMPIGRRLRLERRQLALRVAIGDLAGALDLSAVTGQLTGFADRALDEAIRAAIAERTPGAEPIGFAAIALGKQGSHELNYSSDIDPILIFDPDTLPCRPREEPEDAAVRIARRVVELLQARDGDGYVLRVDLRLRPSPEVTPIALPFDAAVSYYESQALPWERAAFIRARAAAGDRALGDRFLQAIRPFVWRRGLDFGALREIRDISARIRDHHAQGQVLGPGFDLKRGRGGIREVEFFAQIHQLIHGGRDPALRAPATRDALARLADAGRIDPVEAAALSDAYTLLRTIEHRVQMVDDRQTHALPTGAALDGVARLHGLEDGPELVALLRPHVEAVARIYDALDDRRRPALSRDPVMLTEALTEQGLADTGVAERIGHWRAGVYPALRSAAAREALEAVLPVLIPALSGAPNPREAVTRFDRLLERLPSAVNVFRLLEARPTLTALLAAILSHAPPLAEALARRPELLDSLIDASALDDVPPVAALAEAMRGGDVRGDYGARLDHVRRVVGEARFALGTQVVAGASDPLAVAAGYARVAEAATQVLAAATVAEFERAHGVVPDSELVILALGRFGGGALTHASDLDLIYLFTGDFARESDGPKPLGATLYYNRLCQRVTAALSVATAAGPLYPVDTRLRPSGAAGPIAVSLDSFALYQREQAWTWEHMALTRARPVFGSEAARAAVEEVIARVLSGERPARDIRADARTMRGDMAAHKPPRGPLDAKLLPGGLVDLEFAVHVAQLTGRVGLDPDLGRAIAQLVGADLLPEPMAAAHDFLTRMLVTMRLVAPDATEPSAATRVLIAGAVGAGDWEDVVARLDRTRQQVAAVWAAVSEETA
ncbi:glutamate-ammonia-ligase adenylyltransferase [Sphingomonas gellani]|uniref:Glutamate-ammonia-ligase adenylyltransferase n=1 Tax=Sphingomonas gellani TaxID=1166340 RepID=A0A1H8FM33_9SPHN|nr:bifunctional [glutamine synthetase] adenylyltransferase/[glutamine synthetase]-adenylyl-L-tyrosine phosphorylase [Sphingomonas gellani]SEN32793.1 glutamate-ammonia-ligase adenylyltransferase [Sphingomonas gellani]